MKRPKSQALVPAAAQPPGVSTQLSDEELELSGEAIDTFVKALGGRDKLADALAVADSAPEVERIAVLLMDPRYDSYSVRRLCTVANITVMDLFAAYRSAALARAHIEAMPVIAEKLVGVIQDVMTRAQPHYVICTACRGTGSITPEPSKAKPNPGPEPCKTCIGGQILVLPDLDRQKLALEVAEVIKPKGLTINQGVSINNPSGGAGVPGSLEQLQQAVSTILFGSTRDEEPSTPAVDAEIV